MSRYNKNLVVRSPRSLADMQYLDVHHGYNVFQQKDFLGYTAICASDKMDRRDGMGSMAEVVEWVTAREELRA